MQELIILMLLLQIKHFVVDWYYQPPFMWQNKGTYGHTGGILHAGFNAVGTYLCFCAVSFSIAPVFILVLDFVLHYHIDWAKMNINKYKGWGPTTHEQFWQLTGFDQFLHQLTYLLVIAKVYV